MEGQEGAARPQHSMVKMFAWHRALRLLRARLIALAGWLGAPRRDRPTGRQSSQSTPSGATRAITAPKAHVAAFDHPGTISESGLTSVSGLSLTSAGSPDTLVLETWREKCTRRLGALASRLLPPSVRLVLAFAAYYGTACCIYGYLEEPGWTPTDSVHTPKYRSPIYLLGWTYCVGGL